MTSDRWQDIKQKIVASFEVLDSYDEDLDPGTAEVIEFKGPSGKLKVSFNTQPKVLDKKTLYSNRSGSDVRVDYTYSDKEEVCYLKVERWNESTDSWAPIDSSSLF